MSKNLADLGTTSYDDGVDVGNLPEQGRTYPDPPPVGAYRFEMPRLGPDNFDKTKDGKYVKVMFDEHAPLKIVQSVNGTHDGEPFETVLTNTPLERGKKGSGQFASDWDYLNQALGETGPRGSGQQYAQRLIAKTNQATPAQFTADIEYSWRCADDKPAYWPDGNGGVQQVVEDFTGTPRNGCGKKFYQHGVQKVDGAFPVRILCAGCGAQLKAFASLRRFRP